MDNWRRLTIEEAVEALQADKVKGLAQAAVQERRAAHGYNELKEKKGVSVWMMFLLQFRDFLVLLLLGAAAIALLLGEATDAAVIFIVVFINAILGVVQEYKAEKSLAALQTLAAPTAKVVRQGETQEIPARELVPGDLVLLDAGDLVPADALLLEAANLQVNESALTGESLPVEKDASFTAAGPLPPAEQKNAVFMGTMVTSGRARALVAATGMNTEIGRIAGLIQGVEAEQTPLQKKLARLGRQLGLMVLFLCAVIFILGVLRGNEAYGMFLVAVSLAVAGIPEGLPAIVTVVLALGVQRMAARRAIIRKLPAVETLGAATVICSDKTGTLTQNAMNVRRAYCAGGLFKATGEGYSADGGFYLEDKAEAPGDNPHLQLLLTIGALCNDAHLVYGGEGGAGGGSAAEPASVVGDPTEAALLAAAARAGIKAEKLARALPRRFEFPFDAERKRMSTVHSGVLGHPALPF
ncbi:MAG TPA: HAD-IC family P-type ATPase [Bacillota bacterium]|nr:HAD-IC family P-type ATPase [Bacillota bacterium]